jgi:hypothetical protein
MRSAARDERCESDPNADITSSCYLDPLSTRLLRDVA